MANLEALPNELLARIVSFLDRRSTSQLRLTNKRLEDIAVVKLFERVTLYAHWAKQSDGELEERSARESQSSLRHVSDAYYGNDRENFVPRRSSIERRRREIQEDEEDGFIAGSDEDEEDGFIAGLDEDEEGGFVTESDMQGQGRRDPNQRSCRAIEDDVDGFVAGSDEDEEDGFPAELDPQDKGQRDLNQRSRREREDDEDGFVASSNEDEDDGSSNAEDNKLDLRLDSPGREQRSASEASDRPPRPDPLSGRLSDFKLYEKQRRQEWEATRPQWARDDFPGPPDYDAAVFLNILDNERLREFVKEVQIYTCETHCDYHPKTASELYSDFWPMPEFHPRYKYAVKRIGEFPNVCGLTVHFDRHAANSDQKEFFQNLDFQRIWLEQISKVTKKDTTCFAVRHLENPGVLGSEGVPDSEGMHIDMPRFTPQSASVSSLRLSVKHPEMNPDAAVLYRHAEIHRFWEFLPAKYLLPASSTLTTLILYSDIPLGWFPRLDLRAVHLPYLSSLTLGNHILHHDRQVDWIIAHGETLRELIFDRCSILYQIGCGISDWLDDDDYPRKDIYDSFRGRDYGYSVDPYDDDLEDFGRNLLFKSNDLRWSTVFSRLESSLPRLYEFRFGNSSQWDFDTTTVHFRSGATTHMPMMPWEDEHNIESSLFEARYVIWDDWQNEYRTKWMKKTKHGRDEFGVGWRDEWLARAEEYPQCEKEDEEALQELLEITKGR